MRRLRRYSILGFAVLAAWAVPVFLTAQEALLASESFPFGSELVLEAAPIHGSKRVPMIEIEEDGSASIDLWCASLRAQATVGNASISIVPGDPQPSQCEPDRQASDATLLATLTQVTSWRRSGDLIELTGPSTLRFRLMTN